MTDQTPLSQASKEPRLYGVVDILRTDRVAGWVIDRTDPARFAKVEVRRDGQLVGTVTANRPRKDLERQAVGTGAYGFVFTLDPPLEDGMEFTVVVIAKSHDGTELHLQPVASAAKQVSAERKALGRILIDLTDLRAGISDLRQDLASIEKDRAHFQERMELVQLRLESAISNVGSPRENQSKWLTVVVTAGAVIAIGSLAVGLFSLWST